MSRIHAPKSPGLGVLLVAVGAIGMLLVWLALATQYLDAREIDSKCSQAVPVGAVVTEDSSAYEEEITFWPAGRMCTYETESGPSMITQSGWPTTIAAVIGTGLGLVALLVSWLLQRRISLGYLIFTHVNIALAVLGWLSIWIFASNG